MTGRAGTGKSTFLRYIVENIKKKTVVLAPTGIAAVNAGGVTLHSFFKIPLQPFALDDVNYADPRRLKDMQKFNSEKIKLIQEVELIVIDEVSMVRADVLDFVDRVLRTYVRGHRSEPFGGKQLLLVGDAFQLEPVVKREDWDILRRFYTTPYFFGAAVFSQIRLVQVELRKVYRQKESDFLALLDKVRIGQNTPQDLALINTRLNPSFEPTKDDLYITLTATRAKCDIINEQHLSALNTAERIFQGSISGDFPVSSLPTNMLLTLKVDSQVVFVRNDIEHRWYNGTIGRVVRLEDDGVWVDVETDEVDDDGSRVRDTFFVENDIWDNVKYKYDEKEHKVVSETLGSFRQLPLKLAWAITIHKSQGLTFDNVIIDLERGAFACGQVYVALSRCRTLSGIILRQPLSPADIKTNDQVRFFSYGANDESLINGQLQKAHALSLGEQARDAFRQQDFRSAVNALFDALALAPDALKNNALRRYIARQLGIINRLNGEIDNLIEQIERQKQKNFNFAYEYYLMAAECLHQYSDTRSAKANLNKAIGLSPDYTDALMLRGEVELKTGEYEDAVTDITKALQDAKSLKGAKRINALRLRADAFIALRNWRNAYLDLIDVLRRKKDRDKQTLLKMANVCKKLELNDEAQAFRAAADNFDYDDDENDDF